MRPVLLSVWLVVLLAGGSATAGLASIEASDASEDAAAASVWLVRLDAPVTPNDWQALRQDDLEPLRRASSPDEVLVWTSLDRSEISTRLATLGLIQLSEAPGGGVRGLDAPPDERLGPWRLALEPRLPAPFVTDLAGRVATATGASTTTHSLGPALPVILDIATPTTAPSTAHPALMASIATWPGIAWAEPVLRTEARNHVAASLLDHGETSGHPGWLFGLDAEGIVIAVADSGIDRDQACFRNATVAGAPGSEDGGTNATGTPGPTHRVLLALNETIDDWDTSGHSNYRHGTHIAGTLACRWVDEEAAERAGDWVNATPGLATSLSHGAQLIMQDLVAPTGWEPPSPDELHWEAARLGAVIHSNSWGDSTTDYTVRTLTFDAWAVDDPWSLALIAPGNTGGALLEPANGRNVAAIGATQRDASHDLYGASSTGPTVEGSRGILVVAPGVLLLSARADGDHASWNNGTRTSSGTSMATAMAASFAAVVQQLVEDGWLTPPGANSTAVNVSDLRPGWATELDPGVDVQGALALGDGFTPSGALLRALLAASADDLVGGSHGSTVMDHAPTIEQGWGRPNLSRLVDLAGLEQVLSEAAAANDSAAIDPAPGTWIWDSQRVLASAQRTAGPRADVERAVAGRLDLGRAYATDGDGPLAVLTSGPLAAPPQAGPFLAEGEAATWLMPVAPGSDVRLHLAWTSRPQPYATDDLDLIVRFPDGRTVRGDDLSGGLSRVHDNASAASTHGQRTGTDEGVRLSAAQLSGVPWLEMEVVAHVVSPGNSTGDWGADSGRVGFAVAATGLGTGAAPALLSVGGLVPGQAGDRQLAAAGEVALLHLVPDAAWRADVDDLVLTWLGRDGQSAPLVTLSWIADDGSLLANQTTEAVPCPGPATGGSSNLSGLLADLAFWCLSLAATTDPATFSGEVAGWPAHLNLTWDAGSLDVPLAPLIEQLEAPGGVFGGDTWLRWDELPSDVKGPLASDARLAGSTHAALADPAISVEHGHHAALHGAAAALVPDSTDQLRLAVNESAHGLNATATLGLPLALLLAPDATLTAARLTPSRHDWGSSEDWGAGGWQVAVSTCTAGDPVAAPLRATSRPSDCPPRFTGHMASAQGPSVETVWLDVQWPEAWSGTAHLELNISLDVMSWQMRLPVDVLPDWEGMLESISIGGVTAWSHRAPDGTVEAHEDAGGGLLEWDWRARPGELLITVDGSARHDLQTTWSRVEGGGVDPSWTPDGAWVARCGPPAEGGNATRGHAWSWTWSGVTLPPELAGCGEQRVVFELDASPLEVPGTAADAAEAALSGLPVGALVGGASVHLGWTPPWWDVGGATSAAPHGLGCLATVGGSEVLCSSLLGAWDWAPSEMATAVDVRFTWTEPGTDTQRAVELGIVLPALPALPAGPEAGTLKLSRTDTGRSGSWPDGDVVAGWPVLVLTGAGERVISVDDTGTVALDGCDIISVWPASHIVPPSVIAAEAGSTSLAWASALDDQWTWTHGGAPDAPALIGTPPGTDGTLSTLTFALGDTVDVMGTGCGPVASKGSFAGAARVGVPITGLLLLLGLGVVLLRRRGPRGEA